MLNTSASDSENTYDAILVGAGIMSSTLAVLLHELDPDLRVLIVERLSSPGLESSSAKNNAGTGRAGTTAGTFFFFFFLTTNERSV